MLSNGPSGSWEEFVAEATGLCIYGLVAPAGELGVVFDGLAQSGQVESDPIAWHTDEAVLQITLRILRDVGARRDDMVGQAVGWILDNTEAEDQMAKFRLTYRLGEAKVLIGLVNQPPLETPMDARFLEVLRLAGETEGILFNGFRFRDVDGTDLAWAVSPPQHGARRTRGIIRRGSRRPKGRA